jgi:SAM-dependent methyltransferase
LRGMVRPWKSWNEAYLAFETPEAETRKFVRRLSQLGAQDWPKASRVVELFCGRGSALDAWLELGFDEVVGLDLEPDLIRDCPRLKRRFVHGDARALPFEAASVDVTAIHGGLHHLANWDDRDKVISECARVLRNGGRLIVVEPSLDLFLDMVHWVCKWRWARSASSRVDALAEMIELEGSTYQEWIKETPLLRQRLEREFRLDRFEIRFGKVLCLARKRQIPPVDP